MQTVQFERAEAEQVIRAFRDLLLPDMREESFSGRACRALVTVLESRLLAGTDGIWFEDLFPELTDQRTVFMRITEDCDTSDGDIQLRNKFCGDGLLSVSDLCRMSDILTQNEVNTGSDSGAYIRRITEVMRALKQDHTDDIRIALTQDEANAAARALRKAADVEHDKGAAALLYAAIRKLKKEEAMPDKIHLTLTQEEADTVLRVLALVRNLARGLGDVTEVHNVEDIISLAVRHQTKFDPSWPKLSTLFPDEQDRLAIELLSAIVVDTSGEDPRYVSAADKVFYDRPMSRLDLIHLRNMLRENPGNEPYVAQIDAELGKKKQEERDG